VKIIHIYDSIETDFSHNGLVVLTDSKSVFISEELNSKYELELEHPLDDRGKWQYLVEGNIVKADGQLFRIYHKVKTLDGIKINARHIFYDLSSNFILDARPENLSGEAALQWILDRTQYPHSFISMGDVGGCNTRYFIRKNVVDVILGQGGIVETWGGELFRSNFEIQLLKQRGTDKQILISYSKNIQNIEETIDLDCVITRICPVGKDGLLLPEVYVDSPLISNYPHPKIQEILFNNMDNEEDLRTAAQNCFINTKCDIPPVTYQVDFLELTQTEEYKNFAILETVFMGDIVTVKHKRLNIDLKCKVVGIKKQVLSNGKVKIVEVTLGNFKPNLSNSLNKISNSIIEVNSKVDTTKSDLQTSIDNATNQINTALGGYVLKRENELLIMDTPDIMTATEVARWDINGLGFSNTGYNGPYRTAITRDGHIIADFMDTGSLIANIIKSGILQSKNGNWMLNLDGETINLGNKLIFDGTNLQIILSSGQSIDQALDNKADQSIVDTINGDISTINTYFNFGESLKIGKSDSPLQISISNEEMDFLDSGKVIAYVNGQKMYIDSLEVLSSIVVGVHKIFKYDANTTFIQYVG
jgi:phage minor structural protein